MNFQIVRDDLTSGCASGFGIFSIKPKGFWSDVVTVTVRRGPLRDSDEWGWGMGISVASGGRDPNVESDLEAMTYLSEALNHAIDFAKSIDFEVLETRFQEWARSGQ